MTKRMTTEDLRAALKLRWATEAQRYLLGRTIIEVRWMTPAEQESCGWDNAAVVLQLDDGTYLWPAADDEGNGAGALFGLNKRGDDFTLPVIW